MRVAVIGGGPSGLVTLKYLARAHLSLDCDAIEARLFELEDSIGGAFTHRAYEDAEVRICHIFMPGTTCTTTARNFVYGLALSWEPRFATYKAALLKATWLNMLRRAAKS
ncbi:hypothetical protein BFJ63_vAg19875 [Fusarium oxysporum f. sp. narcissi]|uniref:Uncharacterized protein n=1 Tax=Fusarium oxysporum f. sp. narcissi TaxID=451672 RepID=A0A4Q2USV4_FUSOX|nr:hypothetical protein BFJ63_vAg19875 [Fusarium oxysporum f. sp. narcissi]